MISSGEPDLRPYLYGAHVNDVQWPSRDLRAPFQGGCVDFDHLTRSMPLTWELSLAMNHRSTGCT